MIGPRVTAEFSSAGPARLSVRRLATPVLGRTVARRRVDLLLGEAVEGPVTLVTAPTGWGKSIALAWLAARGGWPAAWLRLQATDTSEQLVALLGAALGRAGVAVPSGADREALLEALEGLEDDTLVILDDLHQIEARGELMACLGALIAAELPRLHLVLLGRHEIDEATLAIPVDTARVGATDLAFSVEEAQALWRSSRWLGRDDVEALVAWTRGWPLALQLLATRAEEDRSTAVARLHLHLRREVLECEPREIMEFLMAAAALPDLDPAVCALLDAPTSPDRMLAEAIRRQLVIAPAGESVPGMSPLFRGWLLAEAGPLAARDPEFHRRAAARLVQRGRLLPALHEMLAAGDVRPATDLLLRSSGLAPALLPVAEHHLMTAGRPLVAAAWLFALAGEAARAFGIARQARDEARAAGDSVGEALAGLAVAASSFLLPRADPRELLDRAAQAEAQAPDDAAIRHQARLMGALAAGDTAGAAATLPAGPFASAVHLLQASLSDGGEAALGRLFDLIGEHELGFLLTRRTLLGPTDTMRLVPLLLAGRRLPRSATLAQRLLAEGFPSIAADPAVVDYHPGYTLRVQLLGRFRVWRGDVEVQPSEWTRDRARQLLQLLLVQRGRWLSRDELCSLLWPDLDVPSAVNHFKVTLHAVNAVLEPNRPPRVSPYFIRRERLSYRFAPPAGVWIDVDEFELRSAWRAAADPAVAARNQAVAVDLYRGDLLEEAPFAAWLTDERERLRARYLAAATALAEAELEAGRPAHAAELAERAIARDRSYEPAWRALIRAHLALGNRAQARRAYARLVRNLRDELAVDPEPETTALVAP